MIDTCQHKHELYVGCIAVHVGLNNGVSAALIPAHAVRTEVLTCKRKRLVPVLGRLRVDAGKVDSVNAMDKILDHIKIDSWTVSDHRKYKTVGSGPAGEAWLRSELNQREYCEAHGIPLKAFGNWRVKFKAEPQPPVRKLLYRRGGLSHRLSHTLSHSPSHMTNDPLSRPIVPPARDGHRRAFTRTSVWRNHGS